MIEEWNNRKHIPPERNDFITKRLNLFVQSDEQSFVDFEVIKRNDGMIDPAELAGRNCVGGFDLSQTEDFTAACLEFPLDDGRVFCVVSLLCPASESGAGQRKTPFGSGRRKGC